MKQRQLGFGEAVQICLRKYSDFSGRASRSEYWWWSLFEVIVLAIFSLFGWMISETAAQIFYAVGGLCLLVPSLAVFWRRMHDLGRAGSWFFIGFIPVIGSLLLFVWTLLPSQIGANPYGDEPYTE